MMNKVAGSKMCLFRLMQQLHDAWVGNTIVYTLVSHIFCFQVVVLFAIWVNGAEKMT
jgi:hypothetical protein